jgi:hypothetical protein
LKCVGGRFAQCESAGLPPPAGAFEVYDISDNQITFATGMGQVGLEWTVAGFGDFSSRAGEGDMLMRNSNTGAFEVYDISDNQITFATGMGQVGLEWTVAGFGDFSGNPNETDMLMQNSSTGAFEVYDIQPQRDHVGHRHGTGGFGMGGCRLRGRHLTKNCFSWCGRNVE